KEQSIKGGNPVISDAEPGKLVIVWPLTSFEGSLKIVLTEKQMDISLAGNNSVKWFLDLNTADNVKLPFTNVHSNKVSAVFDGLNYYVSAKKGSFSQPKRGSVLRISPKGNDLILN